VVAVALRRNRVSRLAAIRPSVPQQPMISAFSNGQLTLVGPYLYCALRSTSDYCQPRMPKARCGPRATIRYSLYKFFLSARAISRHHGDCCRCTRTHATPRPLSFGRLPDWRHHPHAQNPQREPVPDRGPLRTLMVDDAKRNTAPRVAPCPRECHATYLLTARSGTIIDSRSAGMQTQCRRSTSPEASSILWPNPVNKCVPSRGRSGLMNT